MGDVRWNFVLSGLGVLPTPSGPEGVWPGGFRLQPGLRLEAGSFFADLEWEAGIFQPATTPLGVNYFDSAYSVAPESPWVLAPSDDGEASDDPVSYVGIRSLSLGAYLAPHFYFRVGPHYYEMTEMDGIVSTHGYSNFGEFAKISVPLGWIGGELGYDQEWEQDTVRRFFLRGALLQGGDATWMGLVEGLMTFALQNGPSAPVFHLTPYFAIRSNPKERGAGIAALPGTTKGAGLGLHLEWDEWTSGLGMAFSNGYSRGAGLRERREQRAAFTFVLKYRPENWLLRGASSFLNAAQTAHANAVPPSGLKEGHVETSVGYELLDSTYASLGYRGVYGAGANSAHVAFLGIQTSFEKTLSGD